MTTPSPRHAAAAAVILSAAALTASADSLRIIASTPGSDIDVPAADAADTVTFFEVAEPVAGFGVTARFTSPVADTGGGVYPWSVDFDITATAPGGASSQSPQPWFGDVSFVDYPVNDAFGGFPNIDGNGTWQLAFDSGVINPFVAGLRDVTYHLLASAPDITFAYDDTTGQGNSWNRPFFIEGVSGLGPVDYHVLTFTVDVSGLYRFESVLPSGNNHFTFLYRDSFDPNLPLENLRDYGLGNGFSSFDVPRGTSRFDQLLFEGTTYFWITSGWGSFSPDEPFNNTITGPGNINTGGPCNPADFPPFGELNIDDVIAFLDAFAQADPAADFAAPFGTFNIDDVLSFLDAFATGCP